MNKAKQIYVPYEYRLKKKPQLSKDGRVFKAASRESNILEQKPKLNEDEDDREERPDRGANEGSPCDRIEVTPRKREKSSTYTTRRRAS